MSRTRTDSPHLLIIAGPNGSGKSSAYEASNAVVAGRNFTIINPDRLAQQIARSEGKPIDETNIEAVRRIENWLETSILAGHTVGVETVLSTPKYRRLVTLAKKLGYVFQLIYVILDSPQRNIERVQIRVKRGGHRVPEEKIITRYWRSLEQLEWFLAQADQAWIWDNSGATIRSIGEQDAGVIRLDAKALPAIVKAAQAADRIS